MKYLDEQGIKDAFAKHLMVNRDYSEAEAKMAVIDFPNPYGLPYQSETYICEEEIDGALYEKRASSCDFECCGIFDLKPFHFYTFYRKEDVPNHKVGEYMNARKLYQVTKLNKNDF